MVKVETPKRVNRSKICPVPYVPVVDEVIRRQADYCDIFTSIMLFVTTIPDKNETSEADLNRTPGAKQLKRSLLESILYNQFIMQSVIIQQYFYFQDVL